jgi:hypothetical protein
MKLTVTVTLDGDEVARQVIRDQDLQNVVTSLAYQAVNLQRGQDNALAEPFAPVVITIEAWTPPASKGK